jgi:propionate catabolism operon transcriptional regulator
LRARSGDILPLASALLFQLARRDRELALRVPSRQAAVRVFAPLEATLRDYSWPGNVRELQNIVERIAVEISEMKTDGDRPVAMTSDALEAIAPELFDVRRDSNVERSLRDLSRSAEVDQVRASLAAFGGDRDAVCKALGISKTTLWRRLNTKSRN